MQSLLPVVDQLASQLQALLPMADEYQRNLTKKIRLEFSYNSNHLEGNTLTYGETELLLIFGKTQGNHDLREYEEMEAHDVAFKIIKEWAADEERPLTEMAIKNLNQTLLIKPYWKDAVTSDRQSARREIKVGDYKEFPNHVRLQNGEMFYYASPADTPIQMGEMIDWYRTETEEKQLHPAVLAALLHYKIVRIHPFDDGNGRISRLLMNYVLIKNNLPPVIIQSVDKKNYLFALNQADTGNIEAFVNYIAEQLVWSLELSIKAAKGESLDEPGDLDKKLFLLKKKLGEDPNAKVEMTCGEEAIKHTIETVIVPLFKKWHDQLEKFAVLFNEKIIIVNLNDKLLFTTGNLGSAAARLMNSIKTSITKSKINTLSFSANLIGLRNKDAVKQMNTGNIVFHYFGNTYEITSSADNKTINKLYHQPLTDEEITMIIESLGNKFYEKVEQALAE